MITRGMVASPIQISAEVLDDLRTRLDRVRLPNQIDGIGWDQGIELDWLSVVLRHWRSQFDWRQVESEMNALQPTVIEIDGQRIHFLHVRSSREDALPLILLHGWPGSVVEFLDVVKPMTEPARDQPAFHLVIPSLPGYGLSGPTFTAGWHPRRMAGAFVELMASLEYGQYAAQGGDWGSIVAQNMADLDPEHVVGLHLNFVAVPRPKNEGDDLLTSPELAQIEAMRLWRETETGYQEIQRTKPQTIGYLLDDSPVGLAAWILEKFRTWSGNVDPSTAFAIDRLLANVTLYWVTQTGASSARLYWEMARAGREAVPHNYVRVPTGVANFPEEITKTPKRWIERRFNITHWTHPRQGGHFPALQVPDLFVADIRSFLAPMVGQIKAPKRASYYERGYGLP